MPEHKWLHEVLVDLIEYSNLNGLPRCKHALEQASSVAKVEVHDLGDNTRSASNTSRGRFP